MTTFTKNKQTGRYDILGLAGAFAEGDTVTVTKKDGSTSTVTIGSVSRPFVAKFGQNKGRKCVIATVSSGRSSSGYTPATRNSRGYVSQRGHHDGYCGYDCPITGKKCCPTNGPCHDCI